MPNTGRWISDRLENRYSIPGSLTNHFSATDVNTCLIPRIKLDACTAYAKTAKLTKELSKEVAKQRARIEWMMARNTGSVEEGMALMVEQRKLSEDMRLARDELERVFEGEKSNRAKKNLGRPAGPAFRRGVGESDEELKPWMSNLTVLERVYNTVNHLRGKRVHQSALVHQSILDLSPMTTHSFQPFSSYKEVVITHGDIHPDTGKFEITMDLISYPGEVPEFDVEGLGPIKDVAWSTSFYDKFVLHVGENPWKSGGRVPGKDAWVVPAQRMWDLVRWSVRVRPYGLLWFENHVELKYAEGASGRRGDLVSFVSDFVEA